MSRHIGSSLTLVTGFALAALWPAAAAAQRVDVQVRVSPEATHELRAAMRELSAELGGALHDITRDLTRDLPRDLGRTLGRTLPDLTRALESGVLDATWDGAWSGGAQERDWRARQEDRQTRSLAIGANGALELRNLSGDITVTAGSGREATVEIIRRSRGQNDADARLGLERVRVDVQVVGSRATVRADYPNERNNRYNVSIDYVVTAPAGTRVTISSVSSDVKVTGVKGELSIGTVSGDITLANVGNLTEAKTASGDVVVNGAESDGTLEAATLSGDVRLTHVKARRLQANTVSGDVITEDITCEGATLTTMSGDAAFSGPLARNGRYELSSHSGDVRFSPTGNGGYTLVASSFGGEITSPSLTLQTSDRRGVMRRRNATATVGDGSANVTLTTFNGDITIKK